MDLVAKVIEDDDKIYVKVINGKNYREWKGRNEEAQREDGRETAKKYWWGTCTTYSMVIGTLDEVHYTIELQLRPTTIAKTIPTSPRKSFLVGGGFCVFSILTLLKSQQAIRPGIPDLGTN